MVFFKEPAGYEKTALSDLQGSWKLLRDTVVDEFGFKDSDKMLFHIDEALSWECVRDLSRMQTIILLIYNIAKQSSAPQSVIECIEGVKYNYDSVLEAIKDGKVP
ncbi:MAG: hypothetical protein QNI92_05480 [Desulfobacterales bacterium]|nr:hypothetical protein [Desulfobacterales bacterium]MDJ0915019.1 hypothetical protein [Desulfobacterales bacterium]